MTSCPLTFCPKQAKDIQNGGIQSLVYFNILIKTGAERRGNLPVQRTLEPTRSHSEWACFATSKLSDVWLLQFQLGTLTLCNKLMQDEAFRSFRMFCRGFDCSSRTRGLTGRIRFSLLLLMLCWCNHVLFCWCNFEHARYYPIIVAGALNIGQSRNFLHGFEHKRCAFER